MAEERMLITGGQRLEGTVRVSGGKNTSVAVISASILSETPCVIENLPNIEDVNVSVETLRHLGAKVNWDPDAGVMEVDSSTIDRTDVPLELCRRMRASSYYIGALLARFGRAQVPLPGGCDIGRRPIDQHIKGMRALGAKVETTRGLVVAQTDGLIGSDVFMDMVTYEQLHLAEEFTGGKSAFLKDAQECRVLLYNGEPIDIEIPVSLVLEVTKTEPGAKGDTVSNVTKPAVLETGVTVQVPLFINEGDKIKVDTRTREYLGRE